MVSSRSAACVHASIKPDFDFVDKLDFVHNAAHTCRPGDEAVKLECCCPERKESRLSMLGEASARAEGKGDMPTAAG